MISKRPTLAGATAAPRWGSWLLGVAVLTAVVLVAWHASEGREIAALFERAQPWWIAIAVLLQAGTYLAQAEVFRGAPRAVGIGLPRRWLYQLSLSKLFLDQALPSAGISSTVVVAKALSRRGVPPRTVAAAAMINIVSYHAAYVVALLIALAIATRRGEANVLVLLVCVLFTAFSLVLTTGVVWLSGRPTPAVSRLRRLPILHGIIGLVEDADARLMRSPRVLGEATSWQGAIIVLDTATIWALIHAIGSQAGADGIFVSFMISSLFRTMGIVPGGLGTYEATAVLTLRMIGTSTAVALAATLMSRGLSFWLPMLPGLVFSRRLTRSVP